MNITVIKLRILNGEKQVWMFPLTKLVRTVGGGSRSEKVVQTVTWLSDLLKKFAIRLVNESVNVKCSKYQSSSHGLPRYRFD